MTVADNPTATTTLAEELGAFVADFDLEAAPDRDALLERARWQILDAIGSCYVAWASEDGHAAKLLAAQAGDIGGGPCTVIGAGGGATAPVAGFLNGTLGHSWDFDDIHLATMIHCQSFATGTTLSVAEERGASGTRLAEAWILAVEVALRLATGLEKLDGLGIYSPEGFHSTSTFGSYGAAAGAAKLMGLDAVETANALALVTSFTAGTVEGWATAGARNKPIQPGWAAHSGITAARLASAGYTCSLRTIDGPQGFYHSHAWGHTWKRERVLDGLGEHWRAREVAVKLNPCGAMCQNTVESIEEVARTHGIAAGDVEGGEIVLPAYLKAALDNMGDSLYRPRAGDALGSAPVLAARVLIDGRLGVEHMADEALSDPQLLALADKLEISLDDDPANAALPVAEQPTRVTLRTARGNFEASQGIAAGHPSRMTEDHILRKFNNNMALVSDPDEAGEIATKLRHLDAVDDVGEITALLAKPARQKGN